MNGNLVTDALAKMEEWAQACEFRRSARDWYGTSKRAGNPADDLLSRVIAEERAAFEAARSAASAAIPHVVMEPTKPRYGMSQRPTDWQDITGKAWADSVVWTICGWDFCYNLVRGWHFEDDTMRGVRLADEMRTPRSREEMANEVMSYLNRCVPATA